MGAVRLACWRRWLAVVDGVIGVSLWGHMMHRGVFLDAQPPGLRLFLRDGCCAIIVSVGRGMGSPCVRACALRFRGALIGGRPRSSFLSGAGCGLLPSVGYSACVRALFARVFLALIGSAYVRSSRCLSRFVFFSFARCCVCFAFFFYSSPPPQRFLLLVSLLIMGFCHSHRFIFYLCFFIYFYFYFFLFSSWCHSIFSDVCAEADDMLFFFL